MKTISKILMVVAVVMITCKEEEGLPAPGTGSGGCPTTANCGCSNKAKAQCDSSCCKWVVGDGCKCR